MIGAEIRRIECEIVAWCRDDDISRRLMTISGGPDAAVGPHAAARVLDLEDIAIEIGNPLPTLDRQLKISDRAPDERFHFAPEEAGILISEVCWRLIAETLVATDLLEFTKERIELARVEWIA